ncbi:hypothetical protein [Streptomyces sp. NPDC020571]
MSLSIQLEQANSSVLRAAADAALDGNTPEALRHFPGGGRYQIA